MHYTTTITFEQLLDVVAPVFNLAAFKNDLYGSLLRNLNDPGGFDDVYYTAPSRENPAYYASITLLPDGAFKLDVKVTPHQNESLMFHDNPFGKLFSRQDVRALSSSLAYYTYNHTNENPPTPLTIDVYMAGPEVFRKDLTQVRKDFERELEKRIAKFGLENVFKFNLLYPEQMCKELDPEKMFAAMIGRSGLDVSIFGTKASPKIVIANLNPFHGTIEPDSGTVFECGVAFARNIPVYGWIDNPKSMYGKVGDYYETMSDGGSSMRDTFITEDFGYPVNLMLMQGCTRVVSCRNGDPITHDPYPAITAVLDDLTRAMSESHPENPLAKKFAVARKLFSDAS